MPCNTGDARSPAPFQLGGLLVGDHLDVPRLLAGDPVQAPLQPAVRQVQPDREHRDEPSVCSSTLPQKPPTAPPPLPFRVPRRDVRPAGPDAFQVRMVVPADLEHPAGCRVPAPPRAPPRVLAAVVHVQHQAERGQVDQERPGHAAPEQVERPGRVVQPEEVDDGADG